MVCSHFSASTRRALAKKGITVYGLQALPVNGSFANCDTGYLVNDKGCGKVWTFRQVLEAAK